jgi:hypothetical protein
VAVTNKKEDKMRKISKAEKALLAAINDGKERRFVILSPRELRGLRRQANKARRALDKALCEMME